MNYFCEDCVVDDVAKHFEVCVKTKNEKEWHKSIPFIFGSEINEHDLLYYIKLLDCLEQKKEIVDFTKIFDEINF